MTSPLLLAVAALLVADTAAATGAATCCVGTGMARAGESDEMGILTVDRAGCAADDPCGGVGVKRGADTGAEAAVTDSGEGDPPPAPAAGVGNIEAKRLVTEFDLFWADSSWNR